MRGRREPRALGELVPSVLDDLGLQTEGGLAPLHACWERILGPELAAHCEATSLRDGVLEATADSSVWCQQASMQRDTILRALRDALGENAPTELWFRVA